jgi:hypothetical protein
MTIDDRMRAAKETGYLLLSKDDRQEIYGRDNLPSTVEFDGNEWTLQLRDFNLDPLAINTSAMPGCTRSSPSKR